MEFAELNGNTGLIASRENWRSIRQAASNSRARDLRERSIITFQEAGDGGITIDDYSAIRRWIKRIKPVANERAA